MQGSHRARAFLAAMALAAGMGLAAATPAAALVPSGPWSSLNPGTNEFLNSISCPGSSTCYAVGYNGVIVVTRDGGASWTGLNSGTTNRLDSISCPSALVCYVAGPFPPTILVTKDGGATWADKSSAASQPLASISCADVNTCVAVGLVGYAVRTSDGGNTWAGTNAPTGSFLLGVSCPTALTCYAVGAAGVVIVKSTDGGATWTDLSVQTDHGLLEIYCPGENSCIAVGGQDRIGQGEAIILTTENGGTTWTSRPSHVADSLFGLTCYGANHCFTTGGFGIVLASDDGGATWSQQVHSSTYASNSVSCLSEILCFAVGGYGAVIASPAGPRTVTNADDSGPGSLRAAIEYANGHPGLDTITFGIGSGPHSIALLSGLPTITDPAVVDASTQPGYAGAPIIELDGTSTGVAHGLAVSAGSSTLRGFVINRFRGFGVWIGFGGGNVVAGNYIGTDLTGTSASPNASNGVAVLGPSTNNLIGGPTPADRNVIAANGDKGVVIAQAGSATIQGNFIGTDANGSTALPNRYFGIAMEPGFDSRVSHNLISGNGVIGVVIGGGSSRNTVDGNLIGTNAAGNAALGNGTWGVVIADSTDNTIGSGNVISGNGTDGVALHGTQSSRNRIAGNLIGTDISGTHSVGNGQVGVAVHGGEHNTIGGSDVQSRNVVSGNGSVGILIGGSSNTVAGNYVGVDRLGTSALGNGNDGVFIYSGSSNVIADRNVISGNGLNGVNLGGPGTTETVVAGNYIGTDATGHSAIGNVLNGVVVSASPGNVIGPGNLLSGNLNSGMLIYGTTGNGNLVQGNLIGTDAGGAGALPNQWWGVVLDGAPNNTVGGAGDSGRNVISGNTFDGILLNGPEANSNLVQNNYIGVDISGTTTVPNRGAGIFLNDSGGNTVQTSVIAGNGQNGVGLFNAHGNTIQGNYIGTDHLGQDGRPNQAFGVALTDSNHTSILHNVISSNAYDGVYIQGGASDHTTLQGNFIGTDASGHVRLGNGGSGVTLESTDDNLIGGTTEAARNVISGNGFSGVFVFGFVPAMRNVVQGNYVGTDVTGTAAIGNGLDGIQVINGSATVIGGTSPGAGNLVSGNSGNGVDILYGATNTVVQGNLIGTDRNGTVAIGNGFVGVDIDTSTSTLVGGATADARNVISGNNGIGVLVFGDSATNNLVQGNYIGPDVNGAAMASNQCNGVMIDAGASRNVLMGNLITHNNCNGVVVWNGVRNAIRGNSIYSNGAMGIDLNNDGVTLNDRGDGDGGANNSQNFPVLSRVVGSPGKLVVEGSIDTPNPQTVTIEIYANASPDPGADFTGYGEGQTLIGTVKPNPAGRFTIVLPPVPKGTVISATATDAQGNTSEFALDRTA